MNYYKRILQEKREHEYDEDINNGYGMPPPSNRPRTISYQTYADKVGSNGERHVLKMQKHETDKSKENGMHHPKVMSLDEKGKDEQRDENDRLKNL